MLKGSKANEWKKRGCTPDGRGGEDKKWRSKQVEMEKMENFSKDENVTDYHVLQQTNHPVIQMSNRQNLMNLCTGFPLSPLDAIREIDLLSHLLTPKSGRINSSEAGDYT